MIFLLFTYLLDTEIVLPKTDIVHLNDVPFYYSTVYDSYCLMWKYCLSEMGAYGISTFSIGFIRTKISCADTL